MTGAGVFFSKLDMLDTQLTLDKINLNVFSNLNYVSVNFKRGNKNKVIIKLQTKKNITFLFNQCKKYKKIED